MEYYSAIKKNEILTFAITWRVLENITLSELSQTEKDKYSMVSLICGILKTQTNKNRLTDIKLMVARGLGEWRDG